MIKCWNCGKEVIRGKYLLSGACYHCGKPIAAPSLGERLGAARSAFLRPPRATVKITEMNDKSPNPKSETPDKARVENE